MIAAWIVVLAGVIMVCFGALPFAGLFRHFFRLFWATGIWNRRPTATVAMVPIGIGISMVGAWLLTDSLALMFAALAAMSAGAAIYITDPSWLRPPWTRLK